MNGARRATGKLDSIQAAFTLIELLVVVSIIALLISVLLPSLSHAREQAKLAKCLGNLRQIGTAMHHYFGEYADTFPWFYPICPVPLGHYYGGRYPTFADPYNIMNEHTWFRFCPEQRPLNEYLYPRARGPKADLRLYHCPSDKTSRWHFPDHVLVIPSGYYNIFGTSYWANALWPRLSGAECSPYWPILPTYANELTRYKLNVRGAGTFVIIYSPSTSTQFWARAALPSRHRRVGFNEMLFLDGHADFMLTDTWTPGWQMKNWEWTFWFNEPQRQIPERFRPPFPGIRAAP